LSHSSIDKPFVDRLALDLDSLNIGVWYDKWEIKVGDSLIDKIFDGIEENDYLAVILSKNSINSDWVKKELKTAFMKEIRIKKIVILPILLDTCEIPNFLEERKFANFTKEYEIGFSELLEVIDPNNSNNENNKEYREIKKMLSGLSTSDNCGANTLNNYQMLDIYKFKNRLINSNYLSYEELRLLFLSKIAFDYKNLSISDLIDSQIPLWELLQNIDENEFASFIVEKINGPLFKYLIRYYKWACDKLNIKIDRDLVMDAAVNASKSSVQDPNDLSKDKIFLIDLFTLLAKIQDDMFNKMNLDNVKNLSKRISTTCGILEGSAYLKNKPSLEGYWTVH